jgi:hypothetical protein
VLGFIEEVSSSFLHARDLRVIERLGGPSDGQRDNVRNERELSSEPMDTTALSVFACGYNMAQECREQSWPLQYP